VLVQGYANVPKRFTDLASARKKTSAILYPIEDPPDGCEYKYIYEDRVRGLSDFAKYIASFGYSAIAIEPPELREILIDKFTKITERYEEEDE
jgi:predicted DNA-binding transcriptional regulator YafY